MGLSDVMDSAHVWSEARDPLEIHVSVEEVSFTQLFVTRNPLSYIVLLKGRFKAMMAKGNC